MGIGDLYQSLFGGGTPAVGITPPSAQTGTLTTTGATTGGNGMLPAPPYIMVPSGSFPNTASPVLTSGWANVVDLHRRELANDILIALLENYPDAIAACAAIRVSAKELAQRAYEMADAMIAEEGA